jgi:NAD(P)-dependent dehydrogenase (short-subunit alcohol dehydrogenase family)
VNGVAVITGAASGIGAGLAREAARRGMQVVLADRDAARLREVVARIGEAALAVPTDVTDPAALETLAERAFAAGPVDLLFNNAGVMVTGNSWEIPLEQWRQAIDVNVLGLVYGLRAFVPRFLAANRPSRIVNTASVGGFLPSPLMAPYSATKFAVVGLTEALAGELRESPIAVSLLAPGPVKSDIFRDDGSPASAAFVRFMKSAVGERGISPDEFAGLVFAAIDRGDYWIVPQPEALDGPLAQRNAIIAERRPPQFYDFSEDA